MEAAGGVHEEHVHAAGRRGLHGVEDHGRRVGTRALADDRRPRPAPPLLELLDRRGPERVGGRKQDALARCAERRRQLARARGFARAVDPQHQDDARRSVHVERRRRPRQGLFEKPSQERAHVRSRQRPRALGLGPHARHEFCCVTGAKVGGDQHLLEFLEHRLVDDPAHGEQAVEPVVERLARPLEPLLQAVGKASEEAHYEPAP